MTAHHTSRRTLLKVLPMPLLAHFVGCAGSSNGPSVTPAAAAPTASGPAEEPEAPEQSEIKTSDRWAEAAELRRRIQLPQIAQQQFAITDFGAVADGTTNNGAAIAKAIAQASQRGGGRVVVPPGTFATGPVHLESGVELHLQSGAVLSFLTDPRLYLPPVLTRWEGIELMGYSPLIYARGKSNVAVTGRGVLDGGASDVTWWPWKGPWKGKFADGPETQKAGRTKLFQDAENDVPPEQRIYAEGAYLRPPCIQFYQCSRVLIEEVTIRNSPFWCMNPVLCRDVTVRGVQVSSHGPNSDGCNPESCEDVIIDSCVFDTGDDCIAIKSGRNRDGRRINIPSRNIYVANCQMKDGHGGVVMGSELSGGIENVFVENCRMDSPNLERGIRIKTNARRGGFVRNLNVRNINIGFVKELLVINFYYEEGPNGPFKPDVRDIVLEDIKCQEVSRVLNIQGLDVAHVRNVELRRVKVGSMREISLLRNIEGLSFSEVAVGGLAISNASALL